MGSWVSVHRDSEAAMRFKLGVGSKGRKLSAGPLPGEEKAGGGGSEAELPEGKPLGTGFYGSKDEAFFDSRAWLDSDCEDDFYSVNGEFTPSRGSTPNHQISAPLTPRLSKTFIETIPDTKSEPSPRKKLAQLLQETLSDGEEAAEEAVAGKGELDGGYNFRTVRIADPPKSLESTPYASGMNSFSSSPKTPNTDVKSRRNRTVKAMQCCLPSVVVPGFGIYDRKKRASSRDLGNGG